MKPLDAETRSQRISLLIIAAAVVALYYFVPYGRYILYPFTLLSTWVHEMGHGLTALLLGGLFDRLEMFSDAAGAAYIQVDGTLQNSMAAAGGLLAPPLVGAFMLALGTKAPRWTLWILTGLMLLSCLLWIRQLTGFLILLPLMALTSAVALWAKRPGHMRTVQLYACVLSLDTMTRGINYMMMPNAYVDGKERASDITRVAESLPGPYQFWGGILALVSVCILLAGLWAAWRKPQRNNTLQRSW